MTKLLQFLLFAAAGAVACAFAMLFSYDFFTTNNRKLPYSYTEFLLEDVGAPRIVIDAGSSSMFGIEPALIEQAFGKPVIDVADNGSIPLDMKIYRLMAYAREGDTLILPLEWVYYTRESVPQDFTDKTPDEYAAYYGSQPFAHRLAFVVRHASLHNLSDAGRLYLRKDLRQVHTARIQADMANWPLGDRKDDRRRQAYVNGKSCVDYIAAAGTMVSDVAWAAAQLADLQVKRHIHVYVTWPAVAGTDCYILKDNRLPIADEARVLFERRGITVVGEPADSYFTPEHMLDTYYHIDSAAARLRTERLVARLRDAGLVPDGTDNQTRGNTTVSLASEAMRKLAQGLSAKSPVQFTEGQARPIEAK
jgi:hypothetical protein